ncbi:NAD-binding protein [Mycena venus]|uniref:NAD-binding protein n=1 Tax=Mycena venus TaxID=2733690 RepID=A0A8H7DC14_9AGAR|nr:NAD-binding protein [Mycena venus]
MPSTISEEHLVALHGKVILITGGNTGIGYATIQILTRRGAKVYMATRSESRAAEAIQRLKAENLGDGSVHWLELDLSDPRSAARAAQEFLQKEQRLDILINNAASAVGPYKLTSDGLWDIMVINHISHFVLTEALLPLMKRTATEPGADVRIVGVTSKAHAFVAPESFATKEALNKSFGDSTRGIFKTYGYTKLANMLHIKALQKRFDAEGARITCIGVHPGATKTPGAQGLFRGIPVIGPFMATVIAPLFFGSWYQGGITVAFAAAGAEVVGPQHERYKGAYFTPKGIETPSKSALDSRLQEELYETTEKVARELRL